MSTRELATMGVRLIALYTLIPAASAASSLTFNTGLPSKPLVLQAVFMVAIGVALWLEAPLIGVGISPSQEPFQGFGLELRSLAQVAFGLVGIVLVVQAASGFAQSLAMLIRFRVSEAAPGFVRRSLRCGCRDSPAPASSYSWAPHCSPVAGVSPGHCPLR